MNSNIKISYDQPYHKLNKKLKFDSLNNYQLFLNWISSEFDLFLQEESNGLKVFFPEGKIEINNKTSKENIIAKINLESKVLSIGYGLIEKVDSLYNLLPQEKNNKYLA